MKILILGQNFAPEPIGNAPYTTQMANDLASRGHSVTVIAAKPYYPEWKVNERFSKPWFQRSREGGVDIFRCPIYIPSDSGGGKGRVLHYASFAASTLIPLLWQAFRKRPDIIFLVAPSLLSAPSVLLAAKLVRAKSWAHIQDFEIEAAFATSIMSRAGFAASFARWYERTVLRAFNRVSTISPQMCLKLQKKGVALSRIIEFRNWSDIEMIKPLTQPSRYRAAWNITTPHIALYSGNIAHKQGISIVIEAARQLRYRDDLTFVICGDGPHRSKLEESARGLNNVLFRQLQPKDQLSDLLGLATVHLLPQLADAADLVLPSKLTNMLASGRPIIATAAPGTGLAAEVEGCGIVTPPGDMIAFAQAIARLADEESARGHYGQAARLRAEHRWARDAILAEAERELLNLASC